MDPEATGRLNAFPAGQRVCQFPGVSRTNVGITYVISRSEQICLGYGRQRCLPFA